MYRTDFWTLWEKARVGCFERTASQHVYYLGWNRSPAQVGCMRQVLRPGALGRPRAIGWRGRWEGVIHVNVWQKPLQYCKVISLQLIKINGKKKKQTYSGFISSPFYLPTQNIHFSLWCSHLPLIMRIQTRMQATATTQCALSFSMFFNFFLSPFNLSSLKTPNLTYL